MFSEMETKVFKKKPDMVLVMVINQRHPMSWAHEGDFHYLFQLDGFYSNVPNVDACKVGAAKIIMVDQVEVV